MAFSADRFWSHVAKGEKCWLWTGSKNTDGYGNAWVDGVCQKAHRVAYRLANGPIRAGGYVLHSCDTPSCVNPAHLWVGTQADNNRDCAAKGRQRGPRGDNHPARRDPSGWSRRLFTKQATKARLATLAGRRPKP